MCHWGLAWALGPYINAQMDSASGVRAYESARAAMALRRTATPVERALIEAMAARYVARPTRANRPGLDSVYAAAMRGVVERFPDDLDAAALLGESLMVLRPWAQWTRTGEPQPGTTEVIAVLEGVLARDIEHPGACHHYIHATEASRFRSHPQRSILGIARGILAGEALAAAGDHPAAIAALRAALPLEDSLSYDEPEPWQIPVRQVLGALLLEAGLAAEAEAAYLRDLEVHPENGWSLAGLELALRAQGRTPEAQGAARRLERVWQRADVWLDGSRKAPRPAGRAAVPAEMVH